MKKMLVLAVIILCTYTIEINSQILEVKEGRSAIVKFEPTGDAEQFPDRLPSGTRVKQMGEADRYYDILMQDGRRGWSYKGNFIISSDDEWAIETDTSEVNEQNLLLRSDVLKIIVVDVEVGDATIIICPLENGERDVLVIDTGENDTERIKKILVDNGIAILNKPIDRLYITHYDNDHFGDAPNLIPLCKRIYDHGNNNIKNTGAMRNYLDAINEPDVDRRVMTLTYSETFSGGVEFECVAVNNSTDFMPENEPSTDSDNDNSIALLISFKDFDYFTGGDLTLNAERSLASGIKNCDVYHVNHHGSKNTSSDIDFVTKLDPEVSISSNGTRHGHPTKEVAQRLINLGSIHLQTNNNPDPRAFQPDFKFIADDTYKEDDDAEELDGALGTITIVVEPVTMKYYIIMPGLPLSEGTFNIEL
jgi:beta-lactamase superfamily II metal-dependent hydrolase